MIRFAPCKINIGLHITERRADGYHDLSGLFYPVPLYDIVESIIGDEPGSQLKIFGADFDSNPAENTVIKAYWLLAKDFSLPGMRFCLGKKIPSGAGLGGGSSDGVAALNLVNDLCHLGINPESMRNYASMLGSDCPFFTLDSPAYVGGRGEILEPAGIDLSGWYICIVHPGFGVMTKEAYRLIIPDSNRPSINELLDCPVDQWKNRIFNDFEAPIMNRHPVIMNIKNTLYEEGAIYASMSGSGSSVYGLFEHRPGLSACFNKIFYWEGIL